MKTLLELMPLEIIEGIIDIIAEDRDEAIDNRSNTLKACSLACSTFLPRCRTHLFMEMEIRTETLSGFYKLLKNSPWIGYYIRELSLSVHVNTLTQLIPPALESFAQIIYLQYLRLEIGNIRRRTSWTILSPSVQSILRHLIRLPTITALTLDSIYDIPAIDMTSRNTLDFLSITGPVSFRDDDEKDATTVSSAPKLLALSYSPQTIQSSLQFNVFIKGKPLFDFRQLDYFCLYWIGTDEFYRLLFEHSPNLETIHICLSHGFPQTGLGSCLRFSLRSLVNLYIHFDLFVSFLDDGDSNSLSELCDELRLIARDNRIEYLSFRVILNLSRQSDVEAIPWNRLDDLLFAPNTWMALKEVDLWVYLREDDYLGPNLDPEMFMAAAKNVQESQLSRLVSNKSFEFNSFFNVGAEDYFAMMGV